MGLKENDYEDLLKTYNELLASNEEEKKNGVHDYSLMNALLKKNDEVHLHSNFIYSMINPKGSHYCGNIFLAKFLESIEKSDFIDIDNARVHKEKGKIDLLIEDGEKVIIIENKLRADDQQHQISRYIQYVKNEYLEEIDNVSDNICVVYLSEYNKKPKPKSESVIGFKYEMDNYKPTRLIWENNEIELFNGAILQLPTDTKLKFSRVKHSYELQEWVKSSKEWLVNNKPNSQALVYAFNEYGLILDRLKDNNWRKIMNLDEYVLHMEDNKKQEKMYQFMKESSKYLKTYMGKKLFREISSILKKSNFKLSNLEWSNIESLNEFTEENCVNWYQEKGTKWQDVALMLTKGDKKYVFCLATKYIYFAEYQDKTNYFSEKNRIKIQAKDANHRTDVNILIKEITKQLDIKL